MSTAIVTGASKGIGRATAARLASGGWNVVLVARNAEALRSISAELGKAEGKVAFCPCDVTHEESVAEMARFTEDRYGWPDLLVNNAGITGRTAPTWQLSRSEWDEVLAANLTGPLLCARAVLPAMIERRSGHIVNIVSITGKRPLPQRSAYAASKMGLVGLTRSLAAEVGKFDVRVNAISPGVVEGERIKGVLAGQATARGVSLEAVRDEFLASTPMERMVTEEEVAAAVVALHGLSGVTGVDLNVAAGLVMY